MARLPGIGDLIGVVQAQTEALAALPHTLSTLNRSVRGLADAVTQARDAVAAVQRLAVRADALFAELEEPVRELAPGLRRLAAVLDDPVIDELPDTMRTMQADVLPVLRQFRETQEKIAGIAATTDQVMAMVDETGRRLSALPGASLLSRRRGFAAPAPVVLDVPAETPATTPVEPSEG